MKFVGWELYIMKFVCYIAGAISHELRHIWNKKGEWQ